MIVTPDHLRETIAGLKKPDPPFPKESNLQLADELLKKIREGVVLKKITAAKNEVKEEQNEHPLWSAMMVRYPTITITWN